MKIFLLTGILAFVLCFAAKAQPPVMAGINGPSAVCSAPAAGSSFSATASNSPTSYTWSVSPSLGVTVAGTGSLVTISFPNTNLSYTVYCVAANSAGVSNQVSFTLTVFEMPTVTFSGFNPVFCQGSSTNLSASPTILFSASSSLSYSWSPPQGLNTTTGASVTASPGVTTTYSLQVTLGNCVNTYPLTLTVSPAPPVTASVNNPTICAGSPLILSVGGAAAYTVSPFAPTGISFFPPGTTNYTVSGTNAAGCTASAVAGVTVYNSPTVSPVASPSVICFGSSAVLSAVGATGYTWTPGVLPNAPIINVSPLVSTTYTLYRVLGACAGTSTVNVQVVPFPNINATAQPTPVCAGAALTLSVNGAGTYTWQPGALTGATQTVFPNVPTNYTVIAALANCSTSAVVPVSVTPSPTISLQSTGSSICQGQSLVINANSSVLPLIWQPGSLSGNAVTVNPTITTLYTASGTNALGCSTTASLLLNVNPSPSLQLTSSQPFVCLGDSVLLKVLNPSAFNFYNWTNGPASPIVLVNPAVTTSYSMTATNAITGCSTGSVITVTVFDPGFTVTGPSSVCAGSSATLSATGAASSYSWTANGGSTAASVVVAPLSNITYYVTGTSGSCQLTRTVSIVVNALPAVTAALTRSMICRNEQSTITAGGATSYTWNTGALTLVISPTLNTTATFTVTGTGPNGCSSTATVTQYVSSCSALPENGSGHESGLLVYPNPSKGDFLITVDFECRLVIFNSLGQLLRDLEFSSNNNNTVSVNGLPEGVYFIYGTAATKSIHQKILVDH